MPRTQKGHNRIGNEASVTSQNTGMHTCALCPTFHPEALPTVTAKSWVRKFDLNNPAVNIR